MRSTLTFSSRGALSELLIDALAGPPVDSFEADAACIANILACSPDILHDDDAQLSLFLMYSVHYGSITQFDAGWEWNPGLIRVRGILEAAMEVALRAAVQRPVAPDATADAVAEYLFALTAPTPGPSLSRFMAKSATVEQAREFLILRSVYTLREADPHSWAIPRLTGRAKAALVEIQADEYGGGRPQRIHAEIFARSMRGAGLDATYATYIDAVPPILLASHNMMSLFGLHRRLRGAIVGHLAAFEMTSSLPNRGYADGFRRLGFGDEVTEYFDEHVEADAVHEQIAGRDLAGALVESEPELLNDVIFGAAACLLVDDMVADDIREAWEHGRSALRVATPLGRA
ncbi:iron-containing redox enzyme family protein [Microbacterium marmarense]|uniref:Iron-containing redox enzyme family protein n=1 Tax=Microbacterium marmarense TaxID=3122051 RepID=A0ABU8LQC1_9MICO